jgi:hypothetical protein
MKLQKVKNYQLKEFVAKLSKPEYDLSPATITGVVNCTKAIIASAIDQNGDCLYPRTWNNEFLDRVLQDLELTKFPSKLDQDYV